jgi:hypothetical protein
MHVQDKHLCIHHHLFLLSMARSTQDASLACNWLHLQCVELPHRLRATTIGLTYDLVQKHQKRAFAYAPCAHDCIPLHCTRDSVHQLCGHFNKLLGPTISVHYAELVKQHDERLAGPDQDLKQSCLVSGDNVVMFEYDSRLFYVARFTTGSQLLITVNQDQADSDAITLIEAYMHRLNHNTVNVPVTKFRPPPGNVDRHNTTRMLWQIIQLSIQCQSAYADANHLQIPRTQCNLNCIENLKTLMAVQYFDAHLSDREADIEDTLLLDERNFVDEINEMFPPVEILP